MKPTDTNTYCARPFIHGLIDTRGDYRPCCRFVGPSTHSAKTSTVDEWWTSLEMDNIREGMLSGKKIQGCQRCYRQEKQGAYSFRQQSNDELGHLHIPEIFPRDWEIQITNLCNLKCLMCNPFSSSQFLKENNRLNIGNWRQRDYDFDTPDRVEEVLRRGRSFVFRGGEPFIIPWLKDIIKGLKESKSIMLITNCTTFDADWIDILSNHDVRIAASVDAYGPLNEYIRYPSDWNTVVNNIDSMRRIENVNLFINTCVSNLNITRIHELIDWAAQEHLYINFDILTNPVHYEPCCIPKVLAERELEHLSKSVIVKERNLDAVKRVLENPDWRNWDKFRAEVRMRDMVRGNSISMYLPEYSTWMI